jgi:Tol biopolymer transport system component
LVVALSVGSVAAAGPSVRNGDITFMRQDQAGFWQTWVASAGMRHQRQLTDEDANSGWPVWAPTGHRLAIDSDRADPDPRDDTPVNDVFVLRKDGSGLRKVTDSVGVSGDPGWSPDGSLLAYQADRGDYPGRQGIYVSRPDGSRLRRITVLPPDAGLDAAARFSPDGRSLVFTRYRDDGRGGEESALFTVRLDGRPERQVTPFALHAGDATWSPDGRRLVLEAYPTPTSRGDVCTVHRDGSRLRNLTRNDPAMAGSADPVWSPDGKLILFLSATTTRGEQVGGLTTMKPNGTARAFVSADPMFEHQPDWAAH